MAEQPLEFSTYQRLMEETPACHVQAKEGLLRALEAVGIPHEHLPLDDFEGYDYASYCPWGYESWWEEDPERRAEVGPDAPLVKTVRKVRGGVELMAGKGWLGNGFGPSTQISILRYRRVRNSLYIFFCKQANGWEPHPNGIVVEGFETGELTSRVVENWAKVVGALDSESRPYQPRIED